MWRRFGTSTFQKETMDQWWSMEKDEEGKADQTRDEPGKDSPTKQQTSDSNFALSKKVKKELRAEKWMYFKTDEAEEAASKGDLKTLYATTRILSGRHCNPNRPVRNKERTLLTTVEDQLARWKEHFQEVLNRPASDQRLQLNSGDPLYINIGEITKEEIHKALSRLKNGKAAGTDNILAQALKEGGTGIINHLYQLLNLIWATEKIPAEWSKGLLLKLPKHGDLFQCGKWRGITLLSISSKVITKIILERVKDAIDNVLRDEQASFRNERSYADQIATSES